jgi:Carbohydrate binding module (family 6)
MSFTKILFAGLACVGLVTFAVGKQAAPKPGYASVNIGANLEGVVDWSYSNAFADLVKQSRGFRAAATPYMGTVKLDANGWPAEDFGLTLGAWSTLKGTGGTYKIQLKCATTPTIAPAASPGVVKNVKRDSKTGIVTADLVYPEGGSQLMLSFTGTNGGATDISVMRPGYKPTDLFTTPFLNHLKRFTTIRFMDWASTNGNPNVNWKDRISPNAHSYGVDSWVPWETCIALCNTLKKDAWINVPHQATDDYVAQLAKLFHSQLDPSLHLYVEYSNEVWNWSFSQATWNLNQAQADVKAGDPDLNFDKINDKYAWTARRIAKRIKTISDQFRKEYGDAAINDRVRPVLATQYAWPGFWLVDGLAFLNARYGPPNNYLYAVAVAPYFNLGDADKQTNLTKTDVLNALTAGANAYKTDLSFDSCATLSRYYNLKLVCYESGSDTFGPNNIAAKKAASLDPAMKPLVTNYLNVIYGYGLDLCNWFVAGATNYDSQYGTWGLTNDMSNQAAPKILGIDSANAQKYVTINQGRIVPGTVDARQCLWRGNTWQTDSILRLSPTDWQGPSRDYFLNVKATGNYKLNLTVGEDSAGNSVEVWLNNSKVGSISIPNTGSSTTYKPTATLPLSLSLGTSVLRLKIASGNAVWVKSFTVK